MVSKHISFAIMSIIAVCVVMTQAMNNDKCKFDPSKLTDNDKRHMVGCVSEITGKPFDPKTFNPDALSEDQKNQIGECMAKKSGVVGADGSFNGDVAKVEFAKIESSDETKAAANAAIDNCVTAGGDSMAIMKCTKEAIDKICEF